MNTGELIRGRRTERKLSRLGVANLCPKVNLGQLGEIESGRTDANVSQIKQICRALDITPADVNWRASA